jgi:hypothetical protein
MDFIKVHLKIKKEKDKEYSIGIMDKSLKESGKTILNKDLESGYHPKETNMKEIGLLINKTVMVFLNAI